MDALDEGTPRRVQVGDLTLAVYLIDGEVFVTDDHCTHGPGSLSEGWLTGYEIECDFHQGCFDVRTGAVTSPPPMLPVRTYPTIVSQGSVSIEIATDT